jgi:hypothetical protein
VTGVQTCALPIYNEKALCRFVGWLLLGISLCMMLIPVGIYLNITWLTYGAVGAMLAVVAGGLIYANTENRFRNDTGSSHKQELKTSEQEVITSEQEENTPENKKSTRWIAVATSAIVCITIGGIGVMTYQGSKDPVVTVADNSIQIKGMYGLSLSIDEISDISLIKKSMKEIGTGSRINGYGGIGNALKGHFKSDSLGEMLLFVQADSSPTIRIERNNGKDIYLSFHDSEKTRALFSKIMLQLYDEETTYLAAGAKVDLYPKN